MKAFKILLSIAFFTSIYSFLYDNYLYQELYERYIPNYKESVEFPTYNLEGEITNIPTATDDLKEYLPFIPLLIYKVNQVSIVVSPILFIVSLLLFLYMLLTKRLTQKKVWILACVGMYLLILVLIVNTPFFD